MPYILLKAVKNIRERGELVTYHPGDTVKVGKQTALQWILNGTAEDAFKQVGPSVLPRGGTLTDKFGVVVLGEEGVSLGPLGDLIGRVKLSYGLPAIPYTHTLIWNPATPMSVKLAEYGFLRILSEKMSWDLAACLLSLNSLADSVGTEAEREKTLKVVGDLRLPVYVSGLVWARRTDAALRVIEAWAAELESGADSDHAFLRSLYTERAMICTLPPNAGI